MKSKRHSPQQIVHKLRQAEARLSAGASIPEICRELGISGATYHRRRNQHGEMKANEAKRLKELERPHSALGHQTPAEFGALCGERAGECRRRA
jgi:putative transposase